MKLKEVAKYLGVSKSTVQRWTYLEWIPHSKTLGGQCRYDAEDIIDLKKRMEQKNSAIKFNAE